MKSGSIRTSIDLPRDLHRRLRAAALRRGCSARQIILKSLEQTIDESEPGRGKGRLSLVRPIVPSRGKPFDLSNERIYEILSRP